MADKKINSANGSPKPATGPTRPSNIHSTSGSGGDAKIPSANGAGALPKGKAFTGFGGRTQCGITSAAGMFNGKKNTSGMGGSGNGGKA